MCGIQPAFQTQKAEPVNRRANRMRPATGCRCHKQAIPSVGNGFADCRPELLASAISSRMRFRSRRLGRFLRSSSHRARPLSQVRFTSRRRVERQERPPQPPRAAGAGMGHAGMTVVIPSTTGSHSPSLLPPPESFQQGAGPGPPTAAILNRRGGTCLQRRRASRRYV